MSLREGMNCLDFGCGPWEVLRLTDELVGPSERIVNLDVDGALGREMAEVLRLTALIEFTFAEHDVENIEEVTG